MTRGPAQQTGAGWRRLAVAIGPLLALALYAPTLSGTFLSDDFLINTMLTHEATPRVDWSEVLADFGRSWAGLEGSDLYRPLISLSFGVTYALFGANPLWFHLLNVLVHAAAALCCALLCASVSAHRKPLAAALGGAVFALHPAAAEPVCWIASRTAGLQVMFATASMALFASYLCSGKTSRFAGTAVCFVLALLCKESAVLVPFSLIAIHALIRAQQDDPPADRGLADHVVMFGILGAYFLLRLAVLGALVGGTDAGVRIIQSEAVLPVLFDKLMLVLRPGGNGLPAPWSTTCGYLVLLTTVLLIASGAGARGERPMWRIAGAGLLWIALYFAPTWRLPVDPVTLGGSRMVYGATTVFALMLATLAARARTPQRLAVLAGILILSLGALGVGRMNQYRAAYGDMRNLQADLAVHAAKATPEHPLAFVSVNAPSSGIPFLNCNALFPLAEIPIATEDTAAVSLGFVFQQVPRSEHLLFDAGPMRAIREQGAFLLDWSNDPAFPKFFVRRRSFASPPALPALEQIEPGRFRTPGSGGLDPFDVEAVEIEVSGAVPGGRLEWRYLEDGQLLPYSAVEPPAVFRDAPRFARFEDGVASGESTLFHVDVSHYLTFLGMGLLGPLGGFDVVLDGIAPDRVVDVRVRRRVDELPLPAVLDDAIVPLRDTATQLRAPEMPEGARSITLFLMGPDTTLTLDVTPGPVALPRDLQDAIAVILRSSRQKRYYVYFEARGTRTWRSPVDRVRFR